MNIFVTDKDPKISAKNLDDKRVVKMIVESAQILSTAMSINGATDTPYRPTHRKHPVVIWASRTKGNYSWLLLHLDALLSEYEGRYHKYTHATKKHATELYRGLALIPDGELEPFQNCAANKGLNIDLKHVADTTLAYRAYLNLRWSSAKSVPKRYGVALKKEDYF